MKKGFDFHLLGPKEKTVQNFRDPVAGSMQWREIALTTAVVDCTLSCGDAFPDGVCGVKVLISSAVLFFSHNGVISELDFLIVFFMARSLC